MLPSTVLLLLLFISGNECRFTREPKCGDTKHFRFDSELPRYHDDLSYCQYYRGETCCNKTHTDKIIKHIYSYAQPNVTSECRSIGLNIGCSPCDPRIGTKQIEGICHSYCDEWYDACKDDYFHFNKRGLLTACSETDLVCTQLSSIINNGTQLCDLSGFDVSYVSIKCYDGIKPKLKPIPVQNQYISSFDVLLKSFRKTALWKNIKHLLRNYNRLKIWQQILVISGVIYFCFAIFQVLMKYCSKWFCPQTTQSKVPSDVFGNDDEALKEREREKIRNKRLQFLKTRMVSEQLNMESQMAKQLGLGSTCNHNEINNEQGDDSNDEDGGGYNAENESDDD